MSFKIQRVNNTEFLISSPENAGKNKVKFTVDLNQGLPYRKMFSYFLHNSLFKCRQDDAETRHFMAEKAGKKILESMLPDGTFSLSECKFRYGSRKWKVVKARTSLWIWILSRLLPKEIFKFPPEKNINFKIKRSLFGSKKNLKSPKQPLKNFWYKKTKNPYAYSNFKRLKQTNDAVSPKLYRKGVREVLPYNEDSLFNNGWYGDPFTIAATKAFQKYESTFSSLDSNLDPLTCEYRFIKEDENILLVHKSSPLITKENLKDAADAYYDYITESFGTEKIQYIAHLYQLNFSDELSPEHVHRVNIGTTNFEIQDVEECSEGLEKLSQSVENTDPETSLEEAYQDQLPRMQFFALCRLLNGSESTIGDFQDWFETLDDLDQLSHESFNELMQIIRPTHDEIKKAYTGKKIVHRVLQSAYTTAESKEFKPSVDQLEVTQSSEKMIVKPVTWNQFFEDLSHIFSKKHLEREHHKEGYRVGALIPAPPGKDRIQRWYKVTSSITNGGILSYTLESTVDDPEMPVIKLYRSTASSSYALGSVESVKNNLCQWNAPGYWGVRDLDRYENDFFRDRTIPIWVGYQYRAEELLQNENSDLEEIFKLLHRGNKTLLENEKYTYRTKTLREVLKDHGSLMDELFWRGVLPSSKIKVPLFLIAKPAFARFGNHLIKRYSKASEEKANRVPKIWMKKDALKLYRFLHQMQKKENNMYLRKHMLALMGDLRTHFLNSKPNAKNQEALEAFKTGEASDLIDHEKTVRKLLDDGNDEEAKDLLQLWSDHLLNIAQDRDEDVASKIPQNIAFTGHSLGGGCAQMGFTRYITNKRRIPLPKQHCLVAVFDDPKTGAVENNWFVEFGNRHRNLLNDLSNGKDKPFKIFRSEEAGDFVVEAGEEHLGAMATAEAERKSAMWLEADFAVYERKATSGKNKTARSRFAHGTRFQGTRRDGVYVRSTPEKGPPDHIRTNYSPTVQMIFDRKGKNVAIPDKNAKKMYWDLNKKVWKIPTLLEKFLTEELRRSIGIIATLISYLLLNFFSNNHKVEDKWLDSNGVFAVGLEGVYSCPIPEHMENLVI